MKNDKVLTELTSKEYVSKITSSTGKIEPSLTSGVWFNRKVTVPSLDLAERLANLNQVILGQNTYQKWIDVDLTTQHLYAYEGDRVAFDFPISSGLPWLPTVTGEFHIWAKVKSQRMTGGQIENGTFYDLPNVPYVQYFYGGYGLHGAYWHNDFGRPRSHGCINIRIADSEKLFSWTDPTLGQNEYAKYNIAPGVGTKVVIHGATPN